LTAYKNDNPLIEKSYDEAINEILEKIDFPQAEKIENKYLPSMSDAHPSDSD